jgi:peptidyl-prolyl cis-trans isomerase SurA
MIYIALKFRDSVNHLLIKGGNNQLKRQKIVLFSLLASLVFISVSQAEIVDKVIAVVNDEVITRSELDRILTPIYAQYKEIYSDEELIKKMEEARRELLLQMIEDKLILQEARKAGIEVSREEVDRRLNDVKSRFASQEEFEEILASQDLSIDILRKRYKEQLMMKKIFDREVRSRVVVLPTQVQEYYKKHIDEFNEPEKVVLRTIMLKVGKDKAKEKVLEKAQDIKKRLDAGEDFGELAKEFSEDASAIEGGLIGYVKKGQLMKEFDEVVFNLKPQEISPIIKSDLGFHIFKVDKKIPAHTRAFSEVREEIQNMLYQQKVNKRFEEWIDKLKENAYISIK